MPHRQAVLYTWGQNLWEMVQLLSANQCLVRSNSQYCRIVWRCRYLEIPELLLRRPDAIYQTVGFQSVENQGHG